MSGASWREFLRHGNPVQIGCLGITVFSGFSPRTLAPRIPSMASVALHSIKWILVSQFSCSGVLVVSRHLLRMGISSTVGNTMGVAGFVLEQCCCMELAEICMDIGFLRRWGNDVTALFALLVAYCSSIHLARAHATV